MKVFLRRLDCGQRARRVVIPFGAGVDLCGRENGAFHARGRPCNNELGSASRWNVNIVLRDRGALMLAVLRSDRHSVQCYQHERLHHTVIGKT